MLWHPGYPLLALATEEHVTVHIPVASSHPAVQACKVALVFNLLPARNQVPTMEFAKKPPADFPWRFKLCLSYASLVCLLQNTAPWPAAK